MAIEIKNVSDFKRALTVGTELIMIHHQKSAGRDERGVVIYKDDEPQKRIVKKSLSTQVCFETETGQESWINFPKHTKVKFDGNRVTYYEPDYRIRDKEEKDLPLIPMLTYIFN